ncbi:MAG: PP0621 family protein [Gammaproteobacteria bacterium]
MGLIRFIFLLLILGVAWFVVKNYLRKQALNEQQGRSRSQQSQIPGKIVQCRQCNVHLPETEALREGDEWFCTQEHRQAWLTRHKL